MIKLIKYAFAAVSILGLVSLAMAQDTASTPPAPSPAAHPLFKPAELNINPAGRFLTHGMIVESVSGNSFVGKIWGTSWTVNVVNASELKFLLQNGEGVGQITLSSVLKSGDEVGVSGWVDDSRELTVNGQVVRNYSLGDIQEFKNRENEQENEQENKDEEKTGKNNEHGKNEEERGANNSESQAANQKTISDIQQQIQSILEQIKLLQGK